MKKLLIILLCTPALWFTSCKEEDKPITDPVKDSLKNVTGELSATVATKEAALDSFFRAFNDIQANLNEIKQKEKIVTEAASKGDAKSREAQIQADIQAIYDLMVKNRQRLAVAKKNLKESDMKIAEMQKTIETLEASLASREQDINSLKQQLETMNVQLSNLNLNYQASEQQSAAKTEQLNTAYYAFGTKKELIKQGVLTKTGGFIGLGRTSKLSENMNMSYFIKVDVTQTKEITLGAKKAVLSSAHPAGSYKFEGADGKAEKLVITDSDKFWSISKYCVITVD
jgi:hypothetical protein